MRDFIITFVSDDVDKMRIFGALLDAGLKEFVITETEQFTYENWKRTVAENETNSESRYRLKNEGSKYE